MEQDKDGVGGNDGLLFAWGVIVSGDGKSVYVASNGDHAVTTFSRDATTGALTFVELDEDGVAGVDGLQTATGVAISADGANVYVGSCGDSAVATFTRDTGTGALTFLEQHKDGIAGVDGLNCARGVAVDPSDQTVYAVGESDDSVVTFARGSGGALTFVERDTGLDGARDVATAADCASVYVASAVGDSVTGFARDATTGALSSPEIEKDGVDGVDGVDQAVGVTTVPDGSSVYVAGEFDDAVTTFSREKPGASACPGPGATATPTSTAVYTMPTATPTAGATPGASGLLPGIVKVAERPDRKGRLAVRVRCTPFGPSPPATCAGRVRVKVKKKRATKRFSFAQPGPQDGQGQAVAQGAPPQVVPRDGHRHRRRGGRDEARQAAAPGRMSPVS